MQTESELLAGLLAVENGAGEAVKIEPKTKENSIVSSAWGRFRASTVGAIIVKPASEAEIAEANERLNSALYALANKGLNANYCTKEEAIAKRAKGLYEEWEVASRALTRLQNTEFGETALSLIDEVVAQRRRVFNPDRPVIFKGNAATEWGNGKELEAIAAYESLTGLKLEKTGDKQERVILGYVESVDFDFSDWFGCTPDSATPEHDFFSEQVYTGWMPKNNGKLIPREFKNPASGVVFDRYRKLKTPDDLKKENANYYWQVIAQMACLDAPYAQWIAYDCDMINPADKFVIINFERDMAVEQVLIDSLFKAVSYVIYKLGENHE